MRSYSKHSLTKESHELTLGVMVAIVSLWKIGSVNVVMRPNTIISAVMPHSGQLNIISSIVPPAKFGMWLKSKTRCELDCN